MPRRVCTLRGNRTSSDLTLRTSALGLNTAPYRVVIDTEHRRSLSSHLILALAPSSPALPTPKVVAADTP